MRVALVQMSSVDDVAANLAAAEKWVAQAADQGAELIALPEMFAYLRREGTPVPCAQSIDGEIVAALRAWAERHRVWLVGGSFHEAIPGETRVHNCSVAVSPRGEIAAVYRKIHLFDVDLSAQGGQVYRESETVAPGSELASFETPAGVVGLSVCYDVRFPELYRSLAARGARFLCVPAAFARETGRDHWEVLLRARDREPVLRPGARAMRPAPGWPTDLRPLDGGRSVGSRDRARLRPTRPDLRGLSRRGSGARARVAPGAGPPAPVAARRLPDRAPSQAPCQPRRCGSRRKGRRRSGVSAMAGQGNGKRAALVIRTGGFEGTRYELAGEETLIGRNPTTDITLLDEGISREHAIILFDEDEARYEIEDLESTNGTKVNGKRVRNAPLAAGDEITIGHTVFEFVLDA